MYMYTYVHMYTYMYICTHVCVHMCIYLYIYIYVHICKYIYICIHTCKYMNTYMHIIMSIKCKMRIVYHKSSFPFTIDVVLLFKFFLVIFILWLLVLTMSFFVDTYSRAIAIICHV